VSARRPGWPIGTPYDSYSEFPGYGLRRIGRPVVYHDIFAERIVETADRFQARPQSCCPILDRDDDRDDRVHNKYAPVAGTFETTD
jgi:hypothetical protein